MSYFDDPKFWEEQQSPFKEHKSQKMEEVLKDALLSTDPNTGYNEQVFYHPNGTSLTPKEVFRDV
ncbi:hypothetical protein PM082_008375 [Marasmius tenuissimus]|nr:hypothetical protein PM082_008375 [Marasmius tenuissimus]